jgi:hypothetical protein
MWRENRDYAITVQSDIVEGLQGATVTAQLMPELKALEKPNGSNKGCLTTASVWRARWKKAPKARPRSLQACR